MDMIPRIFSYAIESCNTAAVGIYMNSHWLWFHLTLSEYITHSIYMHLNCLSNVYANNTWHGWFPNTIEAILFSIEFEYSTWPNMYNTHTNTYKHTITNTHTNTHTHKHTHTQTQTHTHKHTHTNTHTHKHTHKHM